MVIGVWCLILTRRGVLSHHEHAQHLSVAQLIVPLGVRLQHSLGVACRYHRKWVRRVVERVSEVLGKGDSSHFIGVESV